MVSLDRCNGSCYNVDSPFGRICVPNKTADINLNVCKIITRISESKTLTKHINKISIKHRVYKENCVWIPSICACELNRYLKSIVDD